MPYKPAGDFRHIMCNTRRHWYKMPRSPFARGNPMANKGPDEYRNNGYGFTKMGLEWYNKIQKRGRHSKWPGITWAHDAMGHTQPLPNKTFSKHHRNAVLGEPQWDVYTASHQEYRMDGHVAVGELQPILATQLGGFFSHATVLGWLAAIAQRYATVSDVNARVHFPGAFSPNVIPTNFLLHVSLLCAAIVRQAEGKAYRGSLQALGVLRTLDGTQYFAMPHLQQGPAWPVKLAQPGMHPPQYKAAVLVKHKIHPVFTPDHFEKGNAAPP